MSLFSANFGEREKRLSLSSPIGVAVLTLIRLTVNEIASEKIFIIFKSNADVIISVIGDSIMSVMPSILLSEKIENE